MLFAMKTAVALVLAIAGVVSAVPLVDTHVSGPTTTEVAENPITTNVSGPITTVDTSNDANTVITKTISSNGGIKTTRVPSSKPKAGVSTTNVIFGRDEAKSGFTAQDVTSTWTKYLKTGTATGACGVQYSDKSHGACVKSSVDCGRSIYAYTGNGTDNGPHTTVKVVDVCTDLSSTGLYLTLDAFKELGGTVAAGQIANVNWKFL